MIFLELGGFCSVLGNGCLVGVVRVYDEWMDMPVTKYVVYLNSDEAWTKSRFSDKYV